MSPPASHLRFLAQRITQLAEAHEESSISAPHTLLQLRRAARELEQECLSPAEQELEFHHRPHQNACVRIAIELNIFELLDDNGPVRRSELAERAGTADFDFTIRILRGLCAAGLLQEAQLPNGDVVVSHTPLSRRWRLHANQAYAKHQWDNMALALTHMVPFMRTRGFQSPADPSNSPFAYALGAENIDFFHLLQRYPERLASFNQGMTGTATSVASIFRFSSLAGLRGPGEVSLVDVGGGRGHTLQEILDAAPELNDKGAAVVLQDLPAVLENRQDMQVDLERARIQPYDFLRDQQPVRGAAAYLYKSIFHDWPNASCQQILRNLAPAMRGFDSRLLICDLVVDELASMRPYKTMRDVNMMIMAGRERTAHDWEVLLHEAGFRIAHIWGVDNPGNSVIEARLIQE